MATFTATAQVVTWASTEDPRVVFRFVSADGSSGGDGISQAQGDARYLQQSNDLSDLDDAATARGHLGLGSAATSDAADFATAAQGTLADSAVQPGDLGTAAASDVGDFDAAGSAAAAQSAAQGYADALVDDLSGVSDASTARTNLGLGTAAEADIGTGSGDVAAGDAPATAVSTHSSDTTSVHGIADTSALLVDGDPASSLVVGTLDGNLSAVSEGTVEDVVQAVDDLSLGGGGIAQGFAVQSAGLGADDWALPPGQFSLGSASAVGPISAGTIWMQPTMIQGDITVTGVAVRCFTSAASSLVRVGLFAADGEWQPSSLTNEFATFDTTSTGVKSTTGLSVSMPAGRYLIGMRSEGGNPTLVGYSATASPYMQTRTAGLSGGGALAASMNVTTAADFSTLPEWTSFGTAVFVVFMRWTVD